jgi:hypothetical protein
MPGLKLVLDANAVTALFEVGLWDRVVEKCEVFLSRIVVEQEAPYFGGKERDQKIDVSKDVESGRVRVFDVAPSELKDFLDRLDPVYLEKLDPGEAESLAYLLAADEEHMISTCDAIVCRVLGRLERGHQGISLEEMFQKVLLPNQFTKAFREHWTQEGQRE